jgi:sterol desaturase/sphingolipid hydroxylase (fatty acid hydroxylase superfamily)
MSAIFAVAIPFTFVAVACWEARRPSRAVTTPLSLRWFGNIGLFAIAWLLGRVLPFLSAYGGAEIAARHGWGLLNVTPVQSVIAIALSLVALDFTAYWAHRLFHKVPLLWRLHAIHHSDSDLDVTTTIRHHPFEVLAQMLIDASTAIVFGIPAVALALYGGVVLIVQTFNHGNVLVPQRLRWLNAWLMTPDLHRIHHSVVYAENNSNFGNLVSLWDWLFATFRSHPTGALRVGLPEFGPASQSLGKLLLQPLSVAIAPSTLGSAASSTTVEQ